MLVELWQYALDHNAEVHVMMCEQFTGLLRNPKGATQTLAEATASAKRLAKTMPPCRALMKMINDGNRHLCAAVVRLDERCWTFFDPDPECSELHEVELTISRLRLLANTAAIGQAHRMRRKWVDGGVLFEDRRAGGLQVYRYGCGVLFLQFLVHEVARIHFHLLPTRVDILRLVLVHKMVQCGNAPAYQSISDKTDRTRLHSEPACLSNRAS